MIRCIRAVLYLPDGERCNLALDLMRGAMMRQYQMKQPRQLQVQCYISRSDVLHINLQKPDVTIIADLTKADHIPSDTFDCFLRTQTLQVIYDVHAAVKTCHRLLKPEGVLLAVVPGIGQIFRPLPLEKYEQYWRFTQRAAEELFSKVFPARDMLARSYYLVASHPFPAYAPCLSRK